MTWWLWAVAAAIGIALFGLGWITAHTRAGCATERSIVGDRRMDVTLGVFFTVVALVVAADTVQLQVRFNRYVRGQIVCNTRLIDSEAAISEQRRVVDDVGTRYDLAVMAWIDAYESGGIEPGPPPEQVSLDLRAASKDLYASRLAMLEVYRKHALTRCPNDLDGG